MKKYRYFMCGMFTPTDKEEYLIEIPSPFLRDSKDEAMKDEAFGYRFLLLAGEKEPEIVIFEREDFKVSGAGDNKHLSTWVEGNVVGSYTFDQFKEAGGIVQMLKPELKGCGALNAATDFVDTDKTFLDMFPNMQKQKLYYIDSEAYYIDEVTVK